MTTISDLTPVKLSVADVGAASTALANACHANFIGMHRRLFELSPDAAREVWLAAEIFTATARARALGHGRPAPPLYKFTVRHQDICGMDPVSGAGACICTPELTAMAALTPDDLRLPKEES